MTPATKANASAAVNRISAAQSVDIKKRLNFMSDCNSCAGSAQTFETVPIYSIEKLTLTTAVTFFKSDVVSFSPQSETLVEFAGVI